MRGAWTIVIPVKAPSRAKTRLAPELGPDERASLARAFARDTVAAALAADGVGRVIVVGDEAGLVGAAELLPEPPGAGLNAAIAHGIAAARAVGAAVGAPPAAPTGPAAVAVLLGDLPSLRPEQLSAALGAAARHPLAFVRDADETGTTLATARGDVPFAAHFGHHSAAAHAAAAFAELDASDWPGLQRDVDTAVALAAAVALGVGPETRSSLHDIRPFA